MFRTKGKAERKAQGQFPVQVGVSGDKLWGRMHYLVSAAAQQREVRKDKRNNTAQCVGIQENNAFLGSGGGWRRGL